MAQDVTELLGEKFEGFKGQAAIDKLMKEKRGHILGAFHREGLGDIALIWGDETAGLAHIIKRRTEQGINPKDVLYKIDDVIKNGSIKRNAAGYFEILYDRNLVVISPEFKGNKLIFVLTAFKTRKKA
jgi:hypothetical protein